MSKNEFLEEYNKFDSNDNEGLLGFSICNNDDDSYRDIGTSLVNLIEDSSDEVFDIIDKTIIAISGYSLSSLLNMMKDNKDYYESL